MSARVSTEGRQLLQLLADGQWHDREQITVKLASMVPPGKALRRYETRERNRRVKDGPRKSRTLSDEEKIYCGQRNKAVVAINSLKKRYVELQSDDIGQQWIRMRLDAPDILAKPESHLDDDDMDPDLDDDEPDADMPSPVPRRPAPTRPSTDGQIAAFLTEQQIRRMIREEVEHVVSQFQQNIQSWLGTRFSELNGYRNSAARRSGRPGQRR